MKARDLYNFLKDHLESPVVKPVGYKYDKEGHITNYHDDSVEILDSCYVVENKVYMTFKKTKNDGEN